MNKPFPTLGAHAPLDDVAAATPPVVRLRHVRRRFGGVAALDDISLTVQPGEILGIIGRSGAGKSTLIRSINGLEKVDDGTVEFDGQDITRLSETALQPVRRRIGMIFQHFNLLSAKTVADNMGFPLKIAGETRAARQARVAELLELTGLRDKANAYPAQLSGGQKQRVGIARALAAKPLLLLSDEATSALDPETTHSILELLREINRRLGLTIVLITHEMEVIRAIADRVIVLDHGKIVEEGAVAEVFAAPRSETTKSLLRSLRPSLPAHIAARINASGGAEIVLRLDVAGEAARRPLLAEAAAELGLLPRLLHGGIDHVRDQPLGTLFIAVPVSGPGDRDRILHHFDGKVSGLEVLGYVTDPA
ncbi:methionine import ATP-binding protein MetN [Kaistia sp. 32K]|uniref:methionine ABC transporter ATP-binding protein n=1 Tax=Kaistia sp. 32K TaxID=2795690 RepID=UPI0019165141|nr:ATP-binding cassette domain-containing protein [Kaistia sp. 32K]BCP52180.1 methionine import ATP-binding protein MetN [Kaistia sp. 32K]